MHNKSTFSFEFEFTYSFLIDLSHLIYPITLSHNVEIIIMSVLCLINYFVWSVSFENTLLG